MRVSEQVHSAHKWCGDFWTGKKSIVWSFEDDVGMFSIAYYYTISAERNALWDTVLHTEERWCE